MASKTILLNRKSVADKTTRKLWILNNLFAHLSPGSTNSRTRNNILPITLKVSKTKSKIYIMHVLSNKVAMACSKSSKQTKPSHKSLTYHTYIGSIYGCSTVFMISLLQ
jgi:hypothetical protein